MKHIYLYSGIGPEAESVEEFVMFKFHLPVHTAGSPFCLGEENGGADGTENDKLLRTEKQLIRWLEDRDTDEGHWVLIKFTQNGPRVVHTVCGHYRPDIDD